jgi:hypothetical protein
MWVHRWFSIVRGLHCGLKLPTVFEGASHGKHTFASLYRAEARLLSCIQLEPSVVPRECLCLLFRMLLGAVDASYRRWRTFPSAVRDYQVSALGPIYR